MPSQLFEAAPIKFSRGPMAPRVRNRMALAFIEYSLATDEQVLTLRTWVCGESIKREVRGFRARHRDATAIRVIVATGETPKPSDRSPVGERLSHPKLIGER